MSDPKEEVRIIVDVIEKRLEWLKEARPASEEISGLDFCLSKLQPLVNNNHKTESRCLA